MRQRAGLAEHPFATLKDRNEKQGQTVGDFTDANAGKTVRKTKLGKYPVPRSRFPPACSNQRSVRGKKKPDGFPSGFGVLKRLAAGMPQPLFSWAGGAGAEEFEFVVEVLVAGLVADLFFEFVDGAGGLDGLDAAAAGADQVVLVAAGDK